MGLLLNYTYSSNNLVDIISMPIYYDRKNQLIFTVHHSVATIAFYLILVSRLRSMRIFSRM